MESLLESPLNQEASFVVGVECPHCFEVTGLRGVRGQSSSEKEWKCKWCGRNYPNSDALKNYASHVEVRLIEPINSRSIYERPPPIGDLR